jgi:hypothetical protein
MAQLRVLISNFHIQQGHSILGWKRGTPAIRGILVQIVYELEILEHGLK